MTTAAPPPPDLPTQDLAQEPVEAASEQVEQSGQPSATPLAQRAVRGGLWVVAAAYWTIGFGFVANILLTRLLTPEVYGEYALATFFAMLFQLRTKVGLAYAFAQERTVTGTAVGTVFTLDVLLGIGGVAIGLIATPILLALGYSAGRRRHDDAAAAHDARGELLCRVHDDAGERAALQAGQRHQQPDPAASPTCRHSGWHGRGAAA